MQKSRYPEEQIEGTLNEPEAGFPTAVLCCMHGVSEQTSQG